MTQICQIFIEVQVPQNEFKIAKFKNPDIDNQMSDTCAYDPLLYPP